MARKEVESASKANLESSFPIERLLILRRKSLLEFYENYKYSTLDQVEDLFEERIKAAEQALLEIKIVKIISILQFQYFKGIKDVKLLEDFMSQDFMQDEDLLSDFSTKYLFHWVHAQYQEFQNNTEKAQLHFKKSIILWLDNPNYIRSHSRMYQEACFTYFRYMLYQNDPFAGILDEVNFNVLLSKIKEENLSHEEETKYVSLFTLFEILRLRVEEKFQEISQLLNPFLKTGKLINNRPHFEKVIFYYYSALTYFKLGDLANAKNIMEEYLHPMDSRLGENPMYNSVFIMLYLVILFEQGNMKLLRFQINKCKKYLISSSKFTTFEEHFFNMLSQILSDRYKDSLDIVYTRSYFRLTTSMKEDKQRIKTEYVHLTQWVKKKEEATKG